MRALVTAALVAAASATMLASPASAGAQLSIMPKIGTPGAGADLAVRAGDWIVVRVGGGIIPVEPEFEVSDIDFSVDIPATGVGAVDLHLGGSGFRVSGGAFYLADDVIFTGIFGGTVEIDDRTWTAAEVGELRGDVTYEEISPFVSLGFGHAAGRGVGIFLEAGAALIGEPEVELSARGGTRSGDADFRAALDAEELQLEDDLADAKLYPILNFGLRIGF